MPGPRSYGAAAGRFAALLVSVREPYDLGPGIRRDERDQGCEQSRITPTFPSMTTRNVSLPDALDGFVEQQVASGAFPDASEVVSAGLRLLQHRADRRAARLERLRAAIQVGLDELDRGEGIEVQDVSAWLDSLGRREG
jgi:antitoxin ParD1/3/4